MSYASEIRCQIEELQAQRDEIIAHGCDPDDPDSHDWQWTTESHTPDGRIIVYECARCGMQDSS